MGDGRWRWEMEDVTDITRETNTGIINSKSTNIPSVTRPND